MTRVLLRAELHLATVTATITAADLHDEGLCGINAPMAETKRAATCRPSCCSGRAM